jgi:Na+-transporting methylmalonyl-CoA/oxaloacetate decarboxylase beta subunit
MEPIIAPSFFYWIDVIEGIKCLFIILPIACFAIITLIAWLSYDCMSSYSDEERKRKESRKKVLISKTIRYGWIVFVIVFIGILIPTKSTLIKMKIAEYVTKDNVHKVVKYISEIKEETKADVIEIIKELKKGE